MQDALKELLEKGFAENVRQHEAIEKCLFGNGEVGIVGKVARHEEIIMNLNSVNKEILKKLDNIEKFNNRLSGQITLGKYLISLFGLGNIASILYFFVK